MDCYFCRIPFTDILIVLKLLLLLWHNCDASVLHVCSTLPSEEYSSTEVCMSVACISITTPHVLLATGVLFYPMDICKYLMILTRR